MAMTEDQKQEMRGILETLRAQTAAQLEKMVEAARPVSMDESIGRVTRMDAIRQQNMALAGLRSARERIELYTAALQKLQTGTFGDCVSCRGPIGWERLKARPDAELCIQCAR